MFNLGKILSPENTLENDSKVVAERTAKRDKSEKGFVYNLDERRVARYLTAITEGAIGAGSDPIGFLIASHAAAIHEVMQKKGE